MCNIGLFSNIEKFIKTQIISLLMKEAINSNELN